MVARLRRLRRHASTTIGMVCVGGLAVGINGSLFTMFDELVLRPPRFLEADRIVHLGAPQSALLQQPSGRQALRATINALPLADPTYVQESAVFQEGGSALVEWRIRPVFVSPAFFDLLGVKPRLGRPFRDADSVAKPRPVILSDELWRRRFDADSTIIGRTAQIPGGLEDRAWRVVGVMPPGFAFPYGANFWLPFSAEEFPAAFAPTFARLDAGASLEAIRLALPSVTVTPLRAFLRPDGARELALLLLGSLMLLLIAWVQIAALFYAMTADRRGEFLTRQALGATPIRLYREVAADGLVIGGIAATVGLLSMVPLLGAIASWLPPEMIVGHTLRPSWRVLAFCGLVQSGAVVMWMAAAAPWVRRSGRSSSRVHGDSSGDRIRYRLLAVQVAAVTALLLLALAALNSYSIIRQQDVGFNPTRLVAFPLPPPTTPRGTAPADYRIVEARFRQLVAESTRRIRRLNGVESSAQALHLPMTPGPTPRTVVLDAATDWAAPIAHHRVGLNFFTTVGARLTSGRYPAPDEVQATPSATASRAVLVNDTLARLLTRRGKVLGQSIRVSQVSLLEVVGVLADIEDEVLDGAVTPAVYSVLPDESFALHIVARLNDDGTAAEVHETLQQIWGSTRESHHIVSLEEVVWQASADARMRARFLAAITLLCLPLVVMGVVGTTVFTIGRRRRELAIRLSVGARSGELRRLTLRPILGHAVAGVMMGLLAGVVAASAAAQMFPALADLEQTTMVSGPLFVLAAVVGAAAAGSRHIGRGLPAELLRTP